ncbi:hypothetical protein [Streptomyces wuyuanensis]|uniref:hypothetical protein n=1 Tax=Streptomyces wuyuanensis TaxID=1196353 RepID=UPI003D70D536
MKNFTNFFAEGAPEAGGDAREPPAEPASEPSPEAADVMPARDAEAVLGENGPTVTTAELLADLFTEQDGEAA